jgi:two-component system, OmpR family, sensor histidine kinase KdpD
MKNSNKIYNFSIGKQYFFSTIILFFVIVILYFIQNTIGYETVSLILLLIIFLLPLFNFDKGPIILSAFISAIAWDYYFIPPHFTMHIAKTEDGVLLFMFFFVAVTNGVLTSKLKKQKNYMTEKERQSNALYNLLKDFSSANDLNDVLNKTVKNILNVFGFESVIFFPADENKLSRTPHQASNFIPDEMDWLAAETCFKERKEAGNSTDIMQSAIAKYFPLNLNNSEVYIIGVKINDEIKSNKDEMKFLRSFLQETIPYMQKNFVYSKP